MSNLCAVRRRIPNARLRHLARRLWRLGERPTYEFLREVEAGADLVARLESYAALDPEIVAALGGRDLPPPAKIVRERRR